MKAQLSVIFIFIFKNKEDYKRNNKIDKKEAIKVRT